MICESYISTAVTIIAGNYYSSLKYLFMLSRITIEVDFGRNNLPTIQIIEKHSDDVRDRLIGHFLQSLAHTSRWCTIEFIADDSKGRYWRIHPMTPSEIPDEIKLMKSILTAGDSVPSNMYDADHKFGDDVGEDQFKEMFYKRNILNPYSSDSQSHAAYNKGFEECYACFSKAQPNPSLSELSPVANPKQ